MRRHYDSDSMVMKKTIVAYLEYPDYHNEKKKIAIFGQSLSEKMGFNKSFEQLVLEHIRNGGK